MRRFDAGDGLYHLVFANEDTYYLDSLLKLNLRQYLYYELKGKGYESVFFLSGEEGNLFLTFGDARSQTVYERYTEQSAGKKLKNWLWGKEEHADCSGRPLPVSDYGSLLGRVLRMMKGEKKLAFVFQIETFYELSAYPELIEDFCRAGQDNYSRGHIILIQAPVVAGGSRRFLTDPKGVFRSSLFPEIRMIFGEHKNVRIYEKLGEVMGQRLSFLNTLERDDICRTLKHFLLEQGPAMKPFWAKVEDYADVLWGWYHSSQYRAEAGPIFPENEKRLMSVIRNGIADKNTFLKMDRETDRLRTMAGGQLSLIRWISQNCLIDSWQRLIYEDNVLLNRLDGMPFPSSWRQTGGSWIRTLGQIREELKKPSTMTQNPGEEAYVFECVEHMSAACARGDRMTMEKSVEALYYGVCGRFSAQQQDREHARQKLYRSIIKVSEKLYEVTRLYEEDGRKISEYRDRMKACIQAVHDYEKENGLTGQDYSRYGLGKASGGISAQMHSLTAKKTEAVSLRDDIRSREQLRAQKEMLMTRCRENIQKMEMAISNIAVGSMENLKENMAYVSRLVEKAAVDDNMLLSELAEASREVRFTMEEASGMYEEENTVSLADIEREFEELLSEESAGQGEEIEKAVWSNGKLGMDFGSTYTIVSVFREDTVVLEVLSLGEGLSPNIPSVVAKGKGEVTIGFSAKNKTGKKGYTVYKAFKMLLAVTDSGKLAERGYDQENNPEEITRTFIGEVLSQVLESLHETRINSLVVGVPEIWNNSLETLGGKAILRDICRSLDFVDADGVKVVSEPAAASAYFAHNYHLLTKHNFDGCILLLDYGGGTLDITLSRVMPSSRKDGANSMELKVLERKGAGENEEGRVGEAGIVYMETVMDWAIRRSGLTDGEAPEYDGAFYRAVNDLEFELQTSTKKIQLIFEEYGLDYLEELNQEKFVDIEYGREEVSVSYGLLLEVYNQVIWGVFDRKMDEIMEYMDENGIDYMDGSRDDFKIALVGGFGNFYLVKRQIKDKFKLGHNDKRQENIIVDKAGCERAVSLGAALLAADVIGIRSTADFSIGMWAYDINKRICMNYAIRYKQEIEVNTVYYARSSVDGEIFVIQAISGGFDKFLINLGSDDRLANFGLLKEKFAKKLSNVVTNQYHTAVVGFSVDPSNVVSVHVRDYDLMQGVISDEDHVVELTKFNDLFEVATVGTLLG